MRDGRWPELRQREERTRITMSFTLPGLLPWSFRIVLIGQQVVLEASSEELQLSTVLEPGVSRIRCGYDLIDAPQCALIR